MRVFIFEHVAGGGELHGKLPTSLAESGAAMADAALADFQSVGCEVLTTRDFRVEPGHDADRTFTLGPGEDVNEAFDRAARQAEAALVIAPESGGVLGRWLERLGSLGVRSLGSTPPAAGLCGDKLALHDHLLAWGVSTPRTTLDLRELEGTVVAKPRDGAGCEDTCVLSGAQVAARGEMPVMRDGCGLSGGGRYVFQPWCRGLAASVSLIVGGGAEGKSEGVGDVRALAVGEQFVCGEPVLRYEGGRLPLRCALAERAAALAVRAVRTVDGLRGFVGVDVVLGERTGDDMVIEINPRLTLSYVALVRGCEPRVAAALLDDRIEPRWTLPGGDRAGEGEGVVRFDARGRVARECSASADGG